ncbi:PaaI family thioesterase [Anaerovibrio sp.]|uniref:PaaI family thioesterase n=1 Tax=Anaerovibrio sp. TaxID=1872532 RepID=UPI0025C1D0AB|nr:PaaI family thioesterase [Anaerovibrio sp.]
MSTEEEIKKMEDTGNCFACGQNNPIGLKLQFNIISNQFIAKTVVDRNYQSYGGVVHGGILTTMLDEAMGGYLFKTGEPAFTGKLEVRFRKPTPTDVPITVRGWVVSRKRNVVEMKSEIVLEDGTVSAEGSAKMVVMKTIGE